MILVTGGLGFIGSHTARALLDLGEECIVTRHHAGAVPDFLAPHVGTGLVIEELDVEDRAGLERIGGRHSITGVVHLADTGVTRLWRRSGDDAPPVLDGLFDGLFNVIGAARDWNVARVTLASTIGVYAGLEPGPWSESSALPPVVPHAIPTVKRCSELLGSFLGGQLGIELVSVRPSAIWGPGGRPASSFFALPALVHAALGLGPEPARPVYGGEAADVCYVRDCGRAIALLQTAPTLNHSIYNIGSGGLTTNAEVAAALARHVPDTSLQLLDERAPDAPSADPFLDVTRLRHDTGYEPEYDLDRGIADYLAWLASGHER